MIVLKSESLAVSILDPVAEAHLLGTRYCTGGFVFQVEETLRDGTGRGILLSGPTFPDSYNLYDGQGIPDAFQPHLLLERSPEGKATRALGIGIGTIDLARDSIQERCRWSIDTAATEVAFRTAQSAAGWAFDLERTVSLRGRTLRSATRISNTGALHLPFQWYPHPFFPLHPSGECCRFSVPVTVPDGAAYELVESGFLRMKGLPWDQVGHFQLFGHAMDRPVHFTQKHPVTSIVTASCDYVPTRLPVWANRNTVSFEPYYERVLSPKDEARWSITYDF